VKFLNGHDPMLSTHNQRVIDRISQQWKMTPATFANKITGGTWIAAPHLRYISTRIAAGLAKGNARIIISAPPRHGKSELTSVHTPTWVLERYPKNRIILAGYGADLSIGFSRRVRDTFLSADNFPLLNTRVRQDASRVDQFLTSEGGAMYAVGIGGPITGRGADLLLIDDYIKEIKEALSPAYRDYIWNWFVTTAFTRLEPGGSCISIATRWHSDDLIGRILTNLADENWEYIEIPAIAEKDDLLGREVGAPLFPERYPIERLEELRRTLGTIFFSALFQQKPVDESKKITDKNWFKIVKEIPPAERTMHSFKRMRVWDLAATEGGGDYLTGALVSHNQTTNHTYIENVIRKQVSPGQVEIEVKRVAQADGYGVEIGIEREPGSAGKILINHYKTTVLNGYVVKEIPAVNNKLVRAQPFLAAVETGGVSIVEGLYVDQYLAEFDEFPGGANDDQVDTTAAGYAQLTGKKIFSASWGRNRTPGGTANSKQTVQANRKASFTQGFSRGATFGRNRSGVR
jgi:predicted phage terminase large subunit-like protein